MRRISTLIWMVALSLAGCASVTPPGSGQSGSENGPPKGMGDLAGVGGDIPAMVPLAQHCPCDVFKDRAPLKATVVSIDERSVRLRLDQVLAGTSDMLPGAEFGGPYRDAWLCSGPALSADMLPIGSSVLAYFEPGDQAGHGCCELLRCEQACSPLWHQGEDNGGVEFDACNQRCEAETRMVCDTHREEAQLYGSLKLTAWSDDALVFVREAEARWTLPAVQLPLVFAGGASCKAQIDDGYQWLVQEQARNAPAPAADNGNDVAGSSPPPTAAQPPPPGKMVPSVLPNPGQAPPGEPASNAAGSAAPALPPASAPALNPVSVAPGPPSNPDDPHNRCQL